MSAYSAAKEASDLEAARKILNDLKARADRGHFSERGLRRYSLPGSLALLGGIRPPLAESGRRERKTLPEC
jgi:hypothetical protein